MAATTRKNPFTPEESETQPPVEDEQAKTDVTSAPTQGAVQEDAPDTAGAHAPVPSDAEAESAGANVPEDEDKPKKKTSSLGDLIDNDLVDQSNGHADPISATTENLQAVVVNKNGVPLLKVSVRGWIGEEPVTLPAEDAGEFGELIRALEKAGRERRADRKKAEKQS